jgi:hypothetical protein
LVVVSLVIEVDLAISCGNVGGVLALEWLGLLDDRQGLQLDLSFACILRSRQVRS